jgi:stage II sporulation protein D
MAPQMKRIFKIIVPGILLFSLFQGYCLGATGSPEPVVRVAILQGARSFRLKIPGFFEIIDLNKKKVIHRGKNLNTTVTAYRSGILLGGIRCHSFKILVKIEDTEGLSVDNRNFKGDIRLIAKDSRITAVNDIGLEDYVKGILYHEVSHYWPMDALKAQAVVSRSYALYQRRENASQPFDLTNDTYSQVYGGATSERYRTNKAVEDTRGEVLLYQRQVVPAFFHATCGGHTEDVSLLWNLKMPPLKGVACDFCKESPHYQWHLVMTLEELQEKLSAAGKKFKGLENISVAGRDPSGRIIDLSFGTGGLAQKIPAKDFRNLIGPKLLRSTNFEVTVVNHDVVFEGKGWGHGVGLCQWGAYFMAKQGYTYSQILHYYYPQSDVKTYRF